MLVACGKNARACPPSAFLVVVVFNSTSKRSDLFATAFARITIPVSYLHSLMLCFKWTKCYPRVDSLICVLV